MQYGYFDDQKKEYVITNPATPKSWSNYMGDTNYGAIISNNAGGYSFFKSAAQGRFMRFRTNAIPMDQPGRYIYIHDNDSKDYWSASWQPVGKTLSDYKSVCRHGTGYTIIESDYNKIKTETTYFVPLGKSIEYWYCRITNNDDVHRKLGLFTYVEYANHWRLDFDTVNLQYTQYTVNMDVLENVIGHGINTNLPQNNEDITSERYSKHTFLGLAGLPVKGFDTDREAFLGNYRSYNNPKVVEMGDCTQSIAVGNNACGVLQTEVNLLPGHSVEFVVVMGIGSIAEAGQHVVAEASDLNLVRTRFAELKNFWHSSLENYTIESADKSFNSMMNMWSPYNCLITFAWSRAASLVYAGERDGYGYRDTIQDLLGVTHIIPYEVKKRLELMISGQVSTGGAMPVVKFFDHQPGKMEPPAEKDYRSDDCMWLFHAIPVYIKETGEIDFYNQVIPYADKGEDTVLGHMKRAIEFNLHRTGIRGLPCGLLADWNDCLELGHKGETLFVAFQLYYALQVYSEICTLLNKPQEKTWAEKHRENLGDKIEKYGWDGEWYLRAYSEKGKVFGSAKNREGSIWLNPQSFAIISGHAQGERALKLLSTVKKKLASEYGIMLCHPPYTNEDISVIRAVLFNPGMKENGSIFNHTQGWIVMAETIAGNGNQAYDYFKSFMPSQYNEKAEIREIEPYVYSQSTHGKDSPHHGVARLPWLTGAATWAYFSATQYILGIKPEYFGISMNPCIPPHWDKVRIKRVFRNKILNITIHNPDGNEKGVKKTEINGIKLKGAYIPIDKLIDYNNINVFM